MKNTSLFLSSIFLISINLSCSKQENEKNDWEKLKLNGKVESITEQNFDAISESGKVIAGNKTSNSDFDNSISFNKKGFMTQKKLFNIDGTLNSAYVYEYNDENQVTKTTKYNSFESIDRVFVTEFDEKTKEKKSEITYTALGSVDYKDKYFYENNNISRLESYTENGIFYCKWEYEYDKNGNKTKENWFINNTITKTSYKYNNKNQLVEQVEMNQDNIPTKWIYEYDDNGNVKKESCIYSDNSQITKTYEYQYDIENNWINKITLQNSLPLFVTKRTIKYY